MQRRAAAAASAERAASCADDLMQVLIEDSATGSKEGSAGALAVKNQPTENVSGGGMLDALGPVGPLLSFSPGMPPELVDSETDGKKNLEVKQVEKNPSVKSVRAVESQSSRNPQKGRETCEPNRNSARICARTWIRGCHR